MAFTERERAPNDALNGSRVDQTTSTIYGLLKEHFIAQAAVALLVGLTIFGLGFAVTSVASTEITTAPFTLVVAVAAAAVVMVAPTLAPEQTFTATLGIVSFAYTIKDGIATLIDRLSGTQTALAGATTTGTSTAYIDTGPTETTNPPVPRRFDRCRTGESAPTDAGSKMTTTVIPTAAGITADGTTDETAQTEILLV